eukprot:4115122-Pleurochrysis_carterae.AAC.1
MHHSSGDRRRHKHDVRDERHQRPEVLDIAGACNYRRASLLALVLDARFRRDVRQGVDVRSFSRLDDGGSTT